MELFIAIAITHFLALLSPGPDFFLILSTLLRQGQRSAKMICLGVATGNAFIILMIYLSLFYSKQLLFVMVPIASLMLAQLGLFIVLTVLNWLKIQISILRT